MAKITVVVREGGDSLKKIFYLVLRSLLIIGACLFILFGILGIRDHLWHLLIIGILTLFVIIFSFKNTIWRNIRIALISLLVLYALIDVSLIIAGFVVAQTNYTNDEEVTVVILGTDVEGDQPGSLLKPRLDTAIDFLQDHPDVSVIVSGKGRGEYTEAEVMHSYLASKGIDEERIYQENN